MAKKSEILKIIDVIYKKYIKEENRMVKWAETEPEVKPMVDGAKNITNIVKKYYEKFGGISTKYRRN